MERGSRRVNKGGNGVNKKQQPSRRSRFVAVCTYPPLLSSSSSSFSPTYTGSRTLRKANWRARHTPDPSQLAPPLEGWNRGGKEAGKKGKGRRGEGRTIQFYGRDGGRSVGESNPRIGELYSFVYISSRTITRMAWIRLRPFIRPSMHTPRNCIYTCSRRWAGDCVAELRRNRYLRSSLILFDSIRD